MTAGTLYKFFEADDVEAASGTPLVAGEESTTYTIPDGEIWKLFSFGGSSSQGSCEIELLYSNDNGSTWTNPFDDSTNKLTCVHLTTGEPAKQDFPEGFEFTGSGTDVKIKIECKNWNTSIVSEIIAWLSGYMK